MHFLRYNCHIILCFVLCCFTQIGSAQDSQNLIRIGILPFEGPNELQQINQRYQDYALEIFSKDDRFQLLEREQLRIIWQERELQKKEDFLDGYVVEQFQSLGADYLLRGIFDPNLNQLRLDLVAVVNQITVAKEVVYVTPNPVVSRNNIHASVQKMIDKEFPRQREIQILEVLKSNKKKAQEILLLGGQQDGLKKWQRLLVKKRETRTVEGETLVRDVTIGKLVIKEVENENFCRCSVKDGGATILEALEKGETLYCSPE